MTSQVRLSEILIIPLIFRSENRMWSPLSSEEGKTNPYKMNLASEPRVRDHRLYIQADLGTLACRNSQSSLSFRVKSNLQVAIPCLEACTFFLTTPAVFFYYTANDEVIVYFPTGGFLGDGSLSAKLWCKTQFLPAEWKEAKVWIHVGNSVMCRRLCDRCCAFYTTNTH